MDRFENVERAAGETKWSLKQLFAYSFEGIAGFSTLPLSIATWFGAIFSITSMLAMMSNIVSKIAIGNYIFGWIVPTILLVGGIQLVCIGVLGKYLANTYLEVKNRPVYIVGETSEEKIKVRRIV